MTNGSDRPADHVEDKNGRGFFQGRITPKDVDTNGGEDTERTQRTPALRKAMRAGKEPHG